MENIFNKITKLFLDEFNDNWIATIKSFKYDQAQLIVGNKLRPQICLWGYLSTKLPNKIKQTEIRNLASVAVSIELIHKASLLLDDWIDCDQERHGQPAFHIEFSSKEAVLLALNMIGLATIRIKENIINPNIVLPQHYFLCLSSLLEIIYNMAQGALKELRMGKQDLFDTNLTYEISKLETSTIISNSLLIGYYVGLQEESPNVYIENKFDKIGEQCGYLFQAMNDLEFFANPKKLEEHKGNLNTDILNNRKNLVIATLYEISTRNDKKKLQTNPEKYILFLAKKYHIKVLFKNQFEVMFKDIYEQVTEMEDLGINKEWIHGFHGFLKYIKLFGENRLEE